MPSLGQVGGLGEGRGPGMGKKARCAAWLRGGCPRLRFVGNARSITRRFSRLPFSLGRSRLPLGMAGATKERLCAERERPRRGRMGISFAPERGLCVSRRPALARYLLFFSPSCVCMVLPPPPPPPAPSPSPPPPPPPPPPPSPPPLSLMGYLLALLVLLVCLTFLLYIFDRLSIISSATEVYMLFPPLATSPQPPNPSLSNIAATAPS
jgi:hypothetical protein